MVRSMWRVFDGSFINARKLMKKEFLALETANAEIIGKLRTERINLKTYEHAFHNAPSPNCVHNCGCSETVSHYLVDCPQYITWYIGETIN